MANMRQLQEKWEAYRPTKAGVAWAFGAGAAATLAVGFLWGGWVTGGTEAEMRQAAVKDARAELAAIICVDRFLHGATASVDLAALKQTDSWKQDNLIEDGGWVTLPGTDKPVTAAAKLCAERLVEMEIPAPDTAASVDPDAT